MVRFIDEWRRKFPSCMVVKRLSTHLIRSNPLIKQIKRTIVALSGLSVNPLKPEFIIVIFIHYKPRIAVAILDL